MLFGNSINELETRIEEFRNFDICWTSVGQWELMETYILNKINKQLEVTFDCAESERPIGFELERRLPRLKEFLSRPANNAHITMRHTSIYGLRKKLGCNIASEYSNKIIYAEDICPAQAFCVSFPLFLMSLWVLGAKKIILFGCDGNKTENAISTYFHPEEVYKEKKASNNVVFNLTGDSGWVVSAFPRIMETVHNQLNLPYPEIINCSEKSIYDLWQKMSYNDIINYCKQNC